jgi:OTU domain-containing protein 3
VQPSYLSIEDEKRQKEKLAETPVVLPWMIETVTSSLPYLADRKAITKALEENKGNIDKAVSQLLDAEEQASMSSQAGSSSAERDPDSHDEAQIDGPNKKQDRRLSRATRNMLKSSEEKRERNIAIRRSRLLESSHPPMDLVKEEEDFTALATKEPLPASDEDWNPISDPSDNDDNNSEYSEPPRPTLKFSHRTYDPSISNSAPPSTSAKHPSLPNRATHRKKPSARERKDMKKAAQKAAAKERKQASNRSAAGGITNGVTMRVGSNGNTPVINIKTLYI